MHRGRKNTKNKLQRLIKEGRGQGRKEKYQPFTKVTEFASSGFATREKGYKSNRIHELHSDLERAVYLILEWNDCIEDIREQYPLLDEENSLKEVQAIADELGIKYSKLNKKDEIYVMDIDFIISQEIDGKVLEKARAIKLSKELENPRVIEKFQVAKVYCERHNMEFGIITEKEINWTYVRNIQWFLPFKQIDNRSISPENLKKIENALVGLYSEDTCGWQQAMKNIDDKLQVKPGASLAVLKYLVCNNYWEVELQNKPIYTGQDVEVIKINERI